MNETLEQVALRIWNDGHPNCTDFASRLVAELGKQAPVAWVEHHKGGDNLVWAQSRLSCAPLYAAPVLAPTASNADERDAKRYRYWRSEHGWSGYFDDGATNSESATDIDAAIDAAIAQQEVKK